MKAELHMNRAAGHRQSYVQMGLVRAWRGKIEWLVMAGFVGPSERAENNGDVFVRLPGGGASLLGRPPPFGSE